MQEILTILRRAEGQFDHYVAFRAPPAPYWGCGCSDISGLAQSVAWHVGHRSTKEKDYSYELVFSSDMAGVEVPEKVGVLNATSHPFTDDEKASFMRMFDIHHDYFLKHVATS